MIACTGLTKVYRTRDGGEAGIRDVSMEARGGEWVLVRGPSGCGKSTLLLALGGMLRPDGGEVRLGGLDVYGMGPAERARLRAGSVGFVFQLFHLVPYLTVRENVMCGALDGGMAARGRGEALIEELGLGGRREALPGTLSAGEKQRTALARALVGGPTVLLADEPTGNLDPGHSRVVFERMARFRKDGGAVVMVTHGADANGFATRIVEARGTGAPFGFGVAANGPRQVGGL